jgi:hypothetical protein
MSVDVETLKARFAPHNQDYQDNVMFVYTEEELQWWIRLFTKRAMYRASEEKRAKDLYDAENFRDILRVQYPNADIP